MANVSALKALGGIALVVVPLGLSATFARPTFANAINSKLHQQEIEESKNHEFECDKFEKSQRGDKILKDYLASGSGNAREIKP